MLKTPKRQTRFLKRFVAPSDRHNFIGRLYELGIVSMHFETYEDLAKFDDIKYAVDVGSDVELLAQRVESLNLAGDMLWPRKFPTNFSEFPVSRYEWLTIAHDVFLMRYVSVVDCALMLTNGVFECGLPGPECKLQKLKKKGVTASVIDILGEMLDYQKPLRVERNHRFHQGFEREFTDDDITFKIVALYESRADGMTGTDYFGRPISLDISFRSGLVGLQKDFNEALRGLVIRLDRLYDELRDEFEARFGPRIAAATHGLNALARHRTTAC